MKNNLVFLYLQTYLYYLLMGFAITILGIVFIPIGYIFPQMVCKCFSFMSRVILWVLGVELKIFGEIPNDGKTYIVIGNHSSFIDIFLFSAYFRGREGTVFLHEKLLKLPIIGLWFRQLKAIPINPKTGNGVRSGFVRAMKVLKEENIHLILFPEGTRTTTGEMKDFELGCFALAKKTGAYILPLGISGAFNFKPKNRGWIIPGKVVIFTGKPIFSRDSWNVQEFADFAKTKVGYSMEMAEHYRSSTYLPFFK